MNKNAILPRQLPVKKLGVEYKSLSGLIRAQNLERLNSLLSANSASSQDPVGSQGANADLQIQLEFQRIDYHKVLVTGDIDYKVTAVCQRCLQDMPYSINTKISVVLIDILSRIDKKIEGYEPVELDFKGLVDLYQLIEDEMILSLPTAIKHDVNQLDECRILN